MKLALTGALTFVCLLPAEIARADPFTLTTAFSTRGVLLCRGDTRPCSDSGTNSIVLGSGSNMATLTFTGVDTVFEATNHAQRVLMGSFTVDGPEDFTFPTRTNPNTAIFQLNLQVTHTLPFDQTNIKRWGYGPGGEETVRFQTGSTHVGLFLPGPRPVGANYTALVYSFDSAPRINGVGRTDVFADVGVVPEPATMILVGAGLAGMVARRRKRMQDTASGTV